MCGSLAHDSRCSHYCRVCHVPGTRQGGVASASAPPLALGHSSSTDRYKLNSPRLPQPHPCVCVCGLPWLVYKCLASKQASCLLASNWEIFIERERRKREDFCEVALVREGSDEVMMGE